MTMPFVGLQPFLFRFVQGNAAVNVPYRRLRMQLRLGLGVSNDNSSMSTANTSTITTTSTAMLDALKSSIRVLKVAQLSAPVTLGGGGAGGGSTGNEGPLPTPVGPLVIGIPPSNLTPTTTTSTSTTTTSTSTTTTSTSVTGSGRGDVGGAVVQQGGPQQGPPQATAAGVDAGGRRRLQSTAVASLLPGTTGGSQPPKITGQSSTSSAGQTSVDPLASYNTKSALDNAQSLPFTLTQAAPGVVQLEVGSLEPLWVVAVVVDGNDAVRYVRVCFVRMYCVYGFCVLCACY